MVLPLFALEMATAPALGSSLVLDGAEGRHAVAVRRMRAGEGIQVANGRGLRVVGQVSAVAQASLTFSVSEVTHEVEPQPSLVLIQALAKGDRDELAVQAATELGVSTVIPWQADRSVSRWEGPKIQKGIDRWQAIVSEAAKQALRAFTPVVSQPVTSNQLVKSVPEFALLLVLDPTAEQPLSSVDLPAEGSVGLVVGPEGGITDSELTNLAAAGAVRVRLGAEILRTSTAGMAAISALQFRLGRW